MGTAQRVSTPNTPTSLTRRDMPMLTKSERREIKRQNRLRKLKRPTKHHLRPRCRNGNNDPANVLLLMNERHQAWHCLFGNRTLDEVIRVLQRIRSVKGYTDEKAQKSRRLPLL